MKFRKYGITVSRLKESDLELVRNWRNDPVVVKNYEFREYITPEMQKAWFQSISNANNLYTVIEYQGEKIGVINIKNIDWEKREGEGGIFIPDPKYHLTALPAILSFMTTEIQFSLLRWNTGFASVLKENAASQNFIRSLGFEICPGEEEKINQRYFNTRENFEKKAAKIKKAISIVTNNDESLVVIIEPADFDDPIVMQWESEVLKNVTPIRTETTTEGRFYYLS
jgi:UDP-4-amino-4,6-dideoxy-N-acetyl-beta-L-altrosamine N-acetyltransferase